MIVLRVAQTERMRWAAKGSSTTEITHCQIETITNPNYLVVRRL